MNEREAYEALIHGRITSQEYVQTLRDRVYAQSPIGGRYYPRHPLPHPREAVRSGFWDGVRSILTLGRH